MKKRQKPAADENDSTKRLSSSDGDVSSLFRFLELVKLVFAEAKVDGLLHIAIDQLITLSGAERGLIILFEKGGEVIIDVARNLDKKDIEHPQFEISQTIIKHVQNSGVSFWKHNALDDPHLTESDSVRRLKILSVICLPLAQNNESFGVIYLDNRTVRGAFRQETYQLLKQFADLISLATYQALEQRRLQNQQRAYEEELRAHFDFEAIVGRSPQMLRVMKMVSKIADADVPVLIEGETGTGKELVAQAIHYNSQRKRMPLVKINCGALPENLLESELFGYEKGAFTGAYKRHKGLFEQANGGTLFLDEIEEMSPALQVKMLRILQWGEFNRVGGEESRECDVRIVAASKGSLQNRVDERKFRDDLYYRLNLVQIQMPPLRERSEDILVLARYFLQCACKSLSKSVNTMSQEVESRLQQYTYPGNVRELENIVKRATLLCEGDTIQVEHLPAEFISKRVTMPRGQSGTNESFQEAKRKTVEQFERQYLERVLEECGGVICRAAEHAGMHESNFHAKLAKYGIKAENFKSPGPGTKALA